MQHAASSVQHAPCNGKQQKCHFLHARDDSMLASMHCAVLRLSVQPSQSQSQSQSHDKDAPTNAPWQIPNMSVNLRLAPEAVVATTSGAGGWYLRDDIRRRRIPAITA